MAFADLRNIFDAEFRRFPDLLEPYVVMLVEAKEQSDAEAIMRSALRETIRRRYPLLGEAAA